MLSFSCTWIFLKFSFQCFLKHLYVSCKNKNDTPTHIGSNCEWLRLLNFQKLSGLCVQCKFFFGKIIHRPTGRQVFKSEGADSSNRLSISLSALFSETPNSEAPSALCPLTTTLDMVYRLLDLVRFETILNTRKFTYLLQVPSLFQLDLTCHADR